MNRKTRIWIDLAAINISFLLTYSAYYSMQGLQSSLNKSTGTQSLCAFYISATISALFVSPIFISTVGQRRSMALGTLTYSLFTIANCYPRPYTLIPTAIIMGAGAAIAWSAARGYLRVKSLDYSLLDGSDEDVKTTHVFGVFLAFLSASLLIGNVMSSLIFQSVSATGQVNFSSTDVDAANQTRRNTTESTKPITNLHCGMHNCDNNAQNRTDPTEIKEQAIVNSPMPYMLFGVFAFVQTMAAVIQVAILTELTDVSSSQQRKSDTVSPMLNGSSVRNTLAKKEIANQLVSTIKLNISNRTARSLIPIAVDIGVVEGFVMGQLTRDWITCYMGIQYVGYGVCVFGIGSIASSYGCGLLSYCIRRQSMLLGVLMVEIASSLYLLIWEPNMLTDSWILYATFSVYGIIFTSRKTIVNASYAIMFPSDIEAANSSTTVWGAAGAAIAFAISSVICNRVYVIIMPVLGLVGTITFVFAERFHTRSNQINSEEVFAVEQERG